MADRDPGNAFRVERYLWTPELDGPGPKRARVPARIEAYVPAPIRRLELSVSSAALRSMSDAEQSVTALQHHTASLGVESLSAQLLRSEAIASSQMEGVAVPSNRTLAKVTAGGRHHENANAALEAIAAVTDAHEWAAGTEPFTVAIVERLHAAVARGDRALAAHAGALRTKQNWIGPDPHTPVGADFMPPPPDDVPALMDDLCAFLNRPDVPPLVQAAAAHAQFETIHPFADGNGRVGRILLGMVLSRSGLATDVVPPISLVLSRDREAYVSGLTAWRFDGPAGADRWVRVICDALEEVATASRGLADEIDALQRDWRAASRHRRSDATAEKLIAVLPQLGVVGLGEGVARTGRSQEQVRQALNQMEEDGILRQVTVGKRNRQWESVGLFALLDEFERTLSGGTVGAGETR
ncbi:Fic family protein [Patulibacter sp. NPDC049589]|uniref:Fic family protein n=1 Tax=Patulibacter sp. NPDC049589 TaxID=3154731 RepID=UPI0034254A69